MEEVHKKVPHMQVQSPAYGEFAVAGKYKVKVGLRTQAVGDLTVYQPDIQVSPAISVVSIFRQPVGAVNIRLKYVDLALVGDFLLKLQELVETINALPPATNDFMVDSNIAMFLVSDMKAHAGESDEELLKFLQQKIPQVFLYEDAVSRVLERTKELCALANEHLVAFNEEMKKRIESKIKQYEGRKTIGKKEVDEALDQAIAETQQEIDELRRAAQTPEALVQLGQKAADRLFYEELKKAQW